MFVKSGVAPSPLLGCQFSIVGNHCDSSTLGHLSENRHEHSKRREGNCDFVFPVDNPELSRVTTTDDRGQQPAAFSYSYSYSCQALET